MFGLIFAELAGSAINIPVKRLHGQARQSAQDIQIFVGATGFRWCNPIRPRPWPSTSGGP